ncbi:hypothetical protein HYALB_00006125 [Hymenoscyphus albidus]|uniref:Alternative oxidase n=1 Tax=Hymenoscyphus albidus TaxID=595503 RepID=A0A9N9LMD5_9HELO|nr:hypothetical protein HYALB_00006125 [Hymenoscyphus albidus]
MTIGFPSVLNRRYAFLVVTIAAAIWLWTFFERPYIFPAREAWTIHSNSYPVSTSPSTDIFDFAPVDSEAIKSVCFDTTWNSSIVFTCENSVGGIGNIRNSILNCVRYSISAGGALVLPKIIYRNNENISEIRTGSRTGMDYMFDSRHFVDSLRISCPSFKIYESVESIPHYQQKTNGSIPLLPESLVAYVPKTGLMNPEEWRGKFYTWLQKYSVPDTEEPYIVDLDRSYLQYPIYSDGEGFALTFGHILKFRSDVRVLATTVLKNMVSQYSLPIDDLSAPIYKNAFFGAHLRTERDAVEAWPAVDWIYSRYETQAKAYLKQASQTNATKLIYVASGNLTEVSRFAEEAQALDLTVTTKADLLQSRDLEVLETLVWDQQALVDFLVMLKSSDFAGIGHSSFAWNIALKRHIYAHEKKHLQGPQMLNDEYSQIYGLPRGYPEYAACLWP